MPFHLQLVPTGQLPPIPTDAGGKNANRQLTAPRSMSGIINGKGWDRDFMASAAGLADLTLAKRRTCLCAVLISSSSVA